MVRASGFRLTEPGFESCIAVSNLGQAHSPHFSSLFNRLNEYVAIDSGGYLRTNSLRALIATWLDISKRG